MTARMIYVRNFWYNICTMKWTKSLIQTLREDPGDAGQTLTVTGVPTPTNLPNGWEVSVSANGTGRIRRRGFCIYIR